ncbi:MAG TPA: carboxypeptidase-like regulatory domain-containing protein, partial [Thermoanaerobaculia bacterium]|nr:carboxypeptidase-like regulatory domain-containing protein [Thermoanaerobaculia bacterium]
WDVTLMLAKPRQELHVANVQVRRRDGDEYARVNIELSGRRIRGTIVDENDKPIAGAVNVLRGFTPETGVRVDADGSFELLGVDPGRVSLSAIAKGRESVPVEVVVEKDSDPEPVTLVVAPEEEIACVLTTGAGFPIAGAHVSFPAQPGIGSTYSSPSGRFRIAAPRGTSRVPVAILAPGMPAKIAMIDVPARGRTVALIVHEPGGVLRLSGSSTHPWPWIFRDGARFSFATLLTPPAGNGPPSWLRADGIYMSVEPGTYTLCREPFVSDACVQRTIAPGATELFDLPAAKEAAK